MPHFEYEDVVYPPMDDEQRELAKKLLKSLEGVSYATAMQALGDAKQIVYAMANHRRLEPPLSLANVEESLAHGQVARKRELCAFT